MLDIVMEINLSLMWTMFCDLDSNGVSTGEHKYL